MVCSTYRIKFCQLKTCYKRIKTHHAHALNMSKESKFLSRVLRHEPELIGLTLGPGGWVQVDELLRGMKRAGHRLSPDAAQELVHLDPSAGAKRQPDQVGLMAQDARQELALFGHLHALRVRFPHHRRH